MYSLECCINAFSIADEIDNQATDTDYTDWGSTLQHDSTVTTDITDTTYEANVDDEKDEEEPLKSKVLSGGENKQDVTVKGGPLSKSTAKL